MTPTPPVRPETQNQGSSLPESIGTARTQLSELSRQVEEKADGIFSKLKQNFNQFLDQLLESPTIKNSPFLKSIIQFFKGDSSETASANERSPATPSQPQTPASTELPTANAELPTPIPEFNESITRSGWFLYRQQVIWVDFNPSPRDSRDKHIKVPKRTVDYLIGEGYRFNSGITMGEFVERNLLTSVTLPSTFTYAAGVSREIKLNKRAAPKFNAVFREMERRGITYQVDSIGRPFSWRNSRGPRATGLLSNHGLGFALDFNPGRNQFYSSGENVQTDITEEFASVFESHGLTWLGRAPIYDMMHFELRNDSIREAYLVS